MVDSSFQMRPCGVTCQLELDRIDNEKHAEFALATTRRARSTPGSRRSTWSASRPFACRAPSTASPTRRSAGRRQAHPDHDSPDPDCDRRARRLGDHRTRSLIVVVLVNFLRTGRRRSSPRTLGRSPQRFGGSSRLTFWKKKYRASTNGTMPTRAPTQSRLNLPADQVRTDADERQQHAPQRDLSVGGGVAEPAFGERVSDPGLDRGVGIRLRRIDGGSIGRDRFAGDRFAVVTGAAASLVTGSLVADTVRVGGRHGRGDHDRVGGRVDRGDDGRRCLVDRRQRTAVVDEGLADRIGPRRVEFARDDDALARSSIVGGTT